MFLDFDGWHSFGGNATYDRGNCSMSFNVVVLLPIKTDVDFQTCHRHCVYGLVSRFVCNTVFFLLLFYCVFQNSWISGSWIMMGERVGAQICNTCKIAPLSNKVRIRSWFSECDVIMQTDVYWFYINPSIWFKDLFTSVFTYVFWPIQCCW